MIDKFLDPYELKARIAPGLILVLPLLATMIYAAPVLSSWSLFAAGSVCTLALLYGLSLVVRARGKAIEPHLWEAWGGQPSTRFMRYRDPTFGPDLKLSIQGALAREFSARMLNPSDEAKQPGRADMAIVDAFRHVRQYLRKHDPGGLWSKQNTDYGFCRNLLSCRGLWVLIAAGGGLFAALYTGGTGANPLNPASAIGFLSLISAVWVGWLVLPVATKRIADAYAESAWMAFLRIAEEQKSARYPGATEFGSDRKGG
jgi:hypothetical protein